MTKRAWVVLPDLLSIRVFFDTGIATGLRRAPGRAPRGRVSRAARRGGGMARPGARPGCAPRDDLTTGDGLPDRAFARVDATLDRQLGYHPLAIRLNRRHGFHTERMHRAIRTGCSTRIGTAAFRIGPASSMRWSGGSSAPGATFPGGCSRR